MNISHPPKPIGDRLILVGVLLFLYIAIFYLYWPAIHGGLVWDDPELVSRHRLLNSSNWFENTFKKRFLTDAFYYRPIPLLTMVWNGLFGPDYFLILAHLTNVIIFCCNVSMVAIIVYVVSGRCLIASSVAALIYALHPSLIETAAWISGRCDLLATFFILLALLTDVSVKSESILKFIFVSIFFFLAALSKEMVAVFPVILIFWRLYVQDVTLNRTSLYKWATTKKNFHYFGLVILTGLLYLIFRYAMLGSIFGEEGLNRDPRNIGGIVSHAFLVFKTFWWYFLLQLFPHYDLSVIYPTNYPVTGSDFSVISGFALLVFIVYIILNSAFSAKFKYSLLILVIVFLPISNIKVLMAWNNYIHLRFLTLPLAFTTILWTPLVVNWFFSQRTRLKIVIVSAFLLWIISAFANLMVTVPLWSHERSLWSWATEAKPDSSLAWENYASALFDVGEYDKCIEISERAVIRNPTSYRAYITGGYCYFAKEDYQNATRMILGTHNTAIDENSRALSTAVTLVALLDLRALLSKDRAVRQQIDSGLYEQISNRLEHARRTDETNNRAHYLLVAWHVINRNYDAARRLIEEISELQQATVKVDNQKVIDYLASNNIMTDEELDQMRGLLFE